MGTIRGTPATHWRLLTLLTAALAALPFHGHDVVGAAPGALDPSFGRDGTIVTAMDGGETAVHAMGLQTVGIVVAGQTSSWGGDPRADDIGLARIDLGGRSDYLFGEFGVIRTNFGETDYAADMVVLPDDRLVVAGNAFGAPEDGPVLLRYLPDGDVDTTFGTGGSVQMEVPSVAEALAVQPDGAIIIAGYQYSPAASTSNDLALARYHADGSVDTSFGVDGQVITDIAGSEDHLASIAVQDDGRIVVLGWSFHGFGHAVALVRYLPDGTLDVSFGEGGKAIARLPTYQVEVNDLAIQADGKLVVAGSYRLRPGIRRVYVRRYNSDGSLDPSFSGEGVATFSFNGQAAAAEAVALDGIGRIILAGRVHNGEQGDDFGILRLNADGTPDASFGSNGWATADFSADDVAKEVLIQPDGKILVAGEVWVRFVRDLAFARFDGGTPHALAFFPTATDAPPATDDLAMTPGAPPAQPLSVPATSVSWLSEPVSGRFPLSPPTVLDPVFRFVTPCTGASAAGKTVVLFTTDVNGANEERIASGESVGPCGRTEVIELDTHRSIAMSNRRLKLTVSSPAGVHLQLGPRTFLSARVFEGD